jgi:hypothetical protein
MHKTNISLELFKSDSTWSEKLFLVWFSKIPWIYKNNLNRCVPFLVAQLVLTNHRITRLEAKEILRYWCKQGFLSLQRFRGYKIEPAGISAILNRINISEFYQSFGLDLNDDPTILAAIAQKAKQDVKLWLKHAPHGLRIDEDDK